MRQRHGAPFSVVHRGDLQVILLNAAEAEPLVTLYLGSNLAGARETGAAMEVEIDTPSGAASVLADAVVGADGVRSWVRTNLLGGPPPRFTRRVAWRSTFPRERWTGDPGVVEATGLWLGTRAHLVHYPVRSGREINLVAVVQGDWTNAGWDMPGDPAELIRSFAGWADPAPMLLALPDGWRKWALAEVPDAPWTRGRIALAGDAAHAMLPFVAQGGGMAIEDAAVLARMLADPDVPVAAALAEYARIRRPRVLAVASEARRNGKIYHLGGVAALARDGAMRALGPRRLADRMDWIYGWRDG
jgi:salicylate hydroxylase